MQRVAITLFWFSISDQIHFVCWEVGQLLYWILWNDCLELCNEMKCTSDWQQSKYSHLCTMIISPDFTLCMNLHA